MKLLIAAPPFYSHFRPMFSIACAAAAGGADVTVASSEAFRAEVEQAGLRFRQLEINKNANLPTSDAGRGAGSDSGARGSSGGGSAGKATVGAAREQERLQEFIDASYRGPVETLITQGRHRLEDMLANPEELYRDLGALWEELQPDLAVVDQLSYGVSLALHLHGLPFVAYCPPHPNSIPVPGRLYSVPPVWPSCFEICAGDQAQLESVAAEVEARFAERFLDVARACGVPQRAPEYPFALLASHGVIYNYPDFSEGAGGTGPGGGASGASFGSGGSGASGASFGSDTPQQFHAGYGFEPAPLPAQFKGIAAESPTVLITLGTFLSRRHDVLESSARMIKELAPDLRILVGGGTDNPAGLAELQNRLTGIAEVHAFLPQEALLSECEFVVHHGGVGSFSESLYHGVPMIVLPFSSDQFSVAYDVERHGLGAVLDPNALDPYDMRMAFETCEGRETRERCRRWSGIIRQNGGPHAAAAHLLNWVESAAASHNISTATGSSRAASATTNTIAGTKERNT
ncbi:MAG: glycosyltransferase [Spirochaetaceae bacterium]|nr:MAG: glycosyltransferase [Spirochaetaceae bacterium]